MKNDLSSLRLNARAKNALDRADIETVEQLLALSADELKRIPEIGSLTFQEICSRLASCGYDVPWEVKTTEIQKLRCEVASLRGEVEAIAKLVRAQLDNQRASHDVYRRFLDAVMSRHK